MVTSLTELPPLGHQLDVGQLIRTATLIYLFQLSSFSELSTQLWLLAKGITLDICKKQSLFNWLGQFPLIATLLLAEFPPTSPGIEVNNDCQLMIRKNVDRNIKSPPSLGSPWSRPWAAPWWRRPPRNAPSPHFQGNFQRSRQPLHCGGQLQPSSIILNLWQISIIVLLWP